MRETSPVSIHPVDLIEGILGLALTLEHERSTVGAEVALPRTPSLEGELAGVADQVLRSDRKRQHGGCEKGKESARHGR